MRKIVFALILSLGIIFSASGQSPGPMDLVVLLDTSASMSDSYQETSDYLIGPFLREFLRIGDTFHLISFSGAPKVEISRRVEGIGDVETIIGRLLLMYPLDPNSDVSAALSFAENYAASLPGSRHRKVVLVTDGDGGSAAVQTAISDSSARLNRQNSDLQYIKVPITGKPPVSGRPAAAPPLAPAQSTPPARAPAPAAQPGVQPPAQPAQTQQPVQPAPQPQQPAASNTPPAQPGQQQQTPSATQQASQPQSSQPAQTQPGQPASQPQQPSTAATQPSQQPAQQAQAQQGQQAQQQQPSQEAPPAQTPPRQEPAAQPSPEPSQASSGSTGTTQPAQGGQQPGQTPPAQTSPARQPAGGSGGADLPLPLIIGLIILALLILAFIIFLISRNLHSSPNRVMAQASSPTILAATPPEDNREMMSQYAEKQKNTGGPPLAYPPPKRKPMPKDKPVDQNLDFENGAPMLSLFVEDQNTAIGRRNIHAVKSGYTFSVGGGKSDFLIFLVPIPPHIADVNFDGRQCTFIPRKPQYFPDIGSQQVSNCIGKTIRVVSDKNYELQIRIERYEDPLKALNNLLHSINVPGR